VILLKPVLCCRAQPSLPLSATTNPSLVCRGDRTKRTFHYWLTLLLRVFAFSLLVRAVIQPNPGYGSPLTRLTKGKISTDTTFKRLSLLIVTFGVNGTETRVALHRFQNERKGKCKLRRFLTQGKNFIAKFKLRNVRSIKFLLRLISSGSLRDALPDSELSQLSLFRKYKSGVRIYESCELNSKSNVIVIGGYLGNSAKIIFNKYNSNITLFEPIKHFASTCEDNLPDIKKIQVINKAVSDYNGSIEMFLDADSTGTYATGRTISVECIAFSEYLTSTNLVFDLVEMNIEGGEYFVLDDLLKSNTVQLSKYWLIQFHDNHSSHELHRAQIRNALRETHELVFSYAWVWELWKIKDSSS